MALATVLFLQTSLRVGGAEMVWAKLIERLDRRRFRPILCCLYAPGVLGERLIRAGIPVYHGLAAHRWDPRVLMRLVGLLRKERVDVLYMINQPLAQCWGTLCGKLGGVPVLISAIHSTGKINRARRRLGMNGLTLRFMDRVTALSEAHKTYLVKQERLDPDRIEIVPNGIEAERFTTPAPEADLRKRLGLMDRAPVIGIVAMLRPEKAHEVLLQAAARVLAQVPPARFLIVGDGPQRPRLEALAKTLGIADHVSFLGARDDVPDCLSLFDVAVLSSRPVVETLSVSVLEYMAAGKPVVATRVGSLPDLVEEGRSGFLVEPGDAAAIAERILQLLRDPALAERMGKAGQERVRRHYTVEQMVQQYEALFERLLTCA
jgi:glycosyltransferase involved in cell wall biosynthesis